MTWAKRVRRTFCVIVVIGMGGWLSSCRTPVTTVDRQAVAQGKELYHTLACDSCHTLEAVGSTRTYGPTHNQLRATAEQRIQAADYTGQAMTAAEYIRESIVDPKVYVVTRYEQLRFGMTAYDYLSEQEIYTLVQFLLQPE